MKPLIKKLLYRIVAILNRNQYRLWRIPNRNYKVFLNISESTMMWSRARGGYESQLFEAIEKTLKPGMTFLDVGPNKGDFALFAAHLVGPSGRVVAVEPEPSNCSWIERSIKANHLQEICDLWCCAAGDNDGSAYLHIGEKSGWHSLVTSSGKGITVPLVRLDTIAHNLDRVDAVKIDVEGAELQVLRGMVGILTRFHPVIWCELHPQYGVDTEEVRRFLRAYGYTVSGEGNEIEARFSLQAGGVK
jgi:FkbM family methyltransferase